MKSKKINFLILGILACLEIVFAQKQDFDFVSPTPNSKKWKQIDNDTLRLIFPPENENEAQKLAGIMLWQARNKEFTLGNKVRKVSLILHNENAQSNGYVALAPFRSEFYLTPMHQTNELGSINFGTLLSLHEYRHVSQVSNSLKGFSKFLYFLSGERGWAVYHNLSTPNWFFEGDAVITETAFTKQGRGRMPSFLNNYRFLALENIMYSYQKARCGSLRDYVPDHYNLGYMLCRNGLDEFGKNFWPTVYEETCRGKFLFFAFKRNFKHQSSIGLTTFYKQTFEKYYNNWLKDTMISDNFFAQQINKETQVFSSYSYPQFIEKNKYITLKKAFNLIPEFVIIDSEGNEKPVVKAGISSDSYFNYQKDKIIYTETRYNPRYQNLNYNELILIDLKTKNKKQLTQNTRTFAPSFNQSGNLIVATEFKEDLKSYLVVYDLNGKKLKEISKDNYYYTFPKFINDSLVVSAVRDSSGLMSLLTVNLYTNQHNALIPFTNNIISDLTYSNRQIFFSGSFNGKDQIFVYDLKEGKVYKAISRINHSYMPAANDNTDEILFTELTSKGRNLYLAELNPFNREELNLLELDKLQAFQSKNFNSITDEYKSVKGDFKIKDYNPKLKTLNIHSWQPSFDRSKLGVEFISDDIFSTTHLKVGSYYNFTERKPVLNAEIFYGGFYPIFKLKSEVIPIRYLSTVVNDRFTDSVAVFEKNASLFGFIPFNLTRGLYFSKLNIGGGLKYVNIRGITEKSINKNLILIQLSGNFLKAMRTAYQHPFSRKAVYFQFDYFQQLNGNTNQLATFTEFSLPGFKPNSAWLFNLGYLKQQVKSGYLLFSEFNLTRGYTSLGLDQFIRAQFNYHFTIAYPDKGINGLIYFYRIRMNPFIDLGWAQAYTSYKFYPANTTGVEFVADVNFLNTVPGKIGLRFNFRTNNYFNKQTVFTPVQFYIPVYFF